KRKKRYDHTRYKYRNMIERFFRKLKPCRRVASHYEKKAASFAGFIYLTAGLAGAV
ncbi:MAG: transposase, partial [Planctomycetota bacterium]